MEKWYRKIILLAMLWMGPVGWSAPPRGSAGGDVVRPPTIVLIYTDDQGYGDVSALNSEAKFSTPHIDRIAREGMIFSDGHSSDGVCTPSRYSLLTGRYSWRTSLKQGVVGAEGACLIEEDRMTLASLLRKHGYHTGMVGKWHLNMDFPGEPGSRNWQEPITGGPTDRGFDYYWGIAASMNFGLLTYIDNRHVEEPAHMWTRKKHIKEPYRDYRLRPPYDSVKKHEDDLEVAPSFRDAFVLEDLTEKAVDFIEQHAEASRRGRPFFLYVALTSPHLPHAVHPAFVDTSECGKYGDFMTETDHRVGQVLDALDREGLTGETLVIFTSDNGPENNYRYQEEAYGHRCSYIFKGGKRDIYEGGHRVPFLARWPGVIEPGRVVEHPVCQVDFLATFADILGTPLPHHAGEDSYSLLPLMRGENVPVGFRGGMIHHSSRGYFAIRHGDWKLNMLRGSGGSLRPVFVQPGEDEPAFELYNLADDPGETRNVIREYPGIASQLEEMITRYIEQGRSTPGEPQPYVREDWDQLIWMR